MAWPGKTGSVPQTSCLYGRRLTARTSRWVYIQKNNKTTDNIILNNIHLQSFFVLNDHDKRLNQKEKFPTYMAVFWPRLHIWISHHESMLALHNLPAVCGVLDAVSKNRAKTNTNNNNNECISKAPLHVKYAQLHWTLNKTHAYKTPKTACVQTIMLKTSN